MPKNEQKVLSDDFAPDESRYRKCSQPYESAKEAADAVESFINELSELRVKYRIRDLYVMHNVSLIEEDGRETVTSGCTGFGSQHLFETMAACAYGVEKQKKEGLIRQLLAGGE